jgi:hypothetical protein
MTHPTHNNGQPIPVQIFEDDGVKYYRPWDEDATEFALAEMDCEWAGAVSQTTLPAQPAPVHDQLAWQNLRNRIQADIDRTEGRWGMHGHSAVDNDYFTALEWVVERMDEILASAHRQPLTDEEVYPLANEHLHYQMEGYEVSGIYNLARAIEAKLKEKNT